MDEYQRLYAFKSNLNRLLTLDSDLPIYIITVSRTTNYGKSKTIKLSSLRCILDNINKIKINQINICKDRANIIVFNEAFFGQNVPIFNGMLIEGKKIITH